MWELRNALERGFKDRVKSDLMIDLHRDWEDKKAEVDQQLALAGNTVSQLAEELRRAKWKLENLSLSYEKKVAYLAQRIDELAKEPDIANAEVQTHTLTLHQDSGHHPQTVAFRELRIKDSSLEDVIDGLQQRLESQEAINDKAFRGLVTRVSELEKQLKTEKGGNQPTVLVRSSSKERLER